MRRKVLLVVWLLIFSSCNSNSVVQVVSQQATTENPSEFELSVSSIQLPKKLEISTAPKDTALNQKINEIIDGSEFANARWGVIAISLKDGRVIAARDAQKLFMPASTLKLFATAAAIDKVGPEFRWKTSIYGGADISADGRLAGNLTLYGHGAPDLNRAQIAELAESLQKRGLRKVEGDVVGDDSYFRGDGMGDGWLWQDAQWYYGAQASALTFQNNQVEFEYSADDAKSEDDVLTVDNDTKLAPSGKPDAVGVSRYPGSDHVYVWGETHPGPQHVRLAAPDPKIWAARELKKELEKRGVTITGNAAAMDWRSRGRLDEENSTELAFIESQTLGEIVRRTNKNSVNLYAELILRTLGKQFGAEAPDEDSRVNAVRSDDKAGTAVVRKWLRDNGVETGESVLHDGSGLSRLDLVTPETMARLLVYAQQMKNSESFTTSLPAAGVDGTMGGRLSKYAGRVFAKTGSITYVNTLAGYARAKDEDIAFVVFCNDQTHRGEATGVIDQIVAAIAGEASEEVGKRK